MQQTMASLPFEIFELHLFQLIVRFGSFTRAAAKANITQSAITRQIQSMERKLGIALFTRTTRKVSLTAAGELLWRKSGIWLKQIEQTVAELDFLKAQKPILKVGVSPSIGLSYLPGFFVAFRRTNPGAQIKIETAESPAIVSKLLENELEVGLIQGGKSIPRQLQVAHSIVDDFTFIFPSAGNLQANLPLHQCLAEFPLLLPTQASDFRKIIDVWLLKQKIPSQPAMELDNIDLIINLVSLGMGCSLVPNRALPLFLQRRKIAKIPLKPALQRTLLVVIRKGPSGGLGKAFADAVLF
jgi:DNA-binding transcriptional LysR family regulator